MMIRLVGLVSLVMVLFGSDAARAQARLEILAVDVDQSVPGRTVLGIYGASFGSTKPIVLFGGTLFRATMYEQQQIIAEPVLFTPGPGIYRLTVISGADSTQRDDFEVVLGNQGPKGDKGDPGATGATGATGLSVLSKTTAEPSGSNCVVGGAKIEMGLDANRNSMLDSTEVNSALTRFVCTGVPGAQGPQGVQGNPGPQGIQGPKGINQCDIFSGPTVNPGATSVAYCPSGWTTMGGACSSSGGTGGVSSNIYRISYHCYYASTGTGKMTAQAMCCNLQ